MFFLWPWISSFCIWMSPVNVSLDIFLLWNVTKFRYLWWGYLHMNLKDPENSTTSCFFFFRVFDTYYSVGKLSSIRVCLDPQFFVCKNVSTIKFALLVLALRYSKCRKPLRLIFQFVIFQHISLRSSPSKFCINTSLKELTRRVNFWCFISVGYLTVRNCQ